MQSTAQSGELASTLGIARSLIRFFIVIARVTVKFLRHRRSREQRGNPAASGLSHLLANKWLDGLDQHLGGQLNYCADNRS